ncbi:cytochrome P450 [Cryptosporangium phraense]|uniref:Cytochrome P450 n=1 Tax=Cryptosporangium phraense TaxID=2593070 RepID=A0A545APT0_9ACTN|nr:cytochrome P450 [Cryptosporangium phraense]TQS43332.1 cytochrome P450 [Cryptosporangium phraense]
MTTEYDFFLGNELVEDPYPYYRSLRDRCPVLREPHHDVMMVTGYDEAMAVYSDTTTFSSASSVTGPFPGFPVPLEGDDVSDLIEEHRSGLPMSDQIITMDLPTHAKHRALLMRLITPRRLKENEEAIWRLADGLLEPLLAAGKAEFISGFAQPFSFLVISDLLGVPAEDQTEFSRGMGQAGNIGGTGGDSMQHSPLEFLYSQFSTYIAGRRENPRNDVLTGMASATFPDGSQPEVIEVVRVAANVFAAGQETTVRLLGAAVQRLAEDAPLQALLRRERDRIPQFIEETLRFESPVKGDFRVSRTATTVGGVDIPAGTTVMVVNAAANRDPRHFDDPETFDLDRTNARHHMAFGRGIHTCPGAPLARAEARACLERLLDRTSDIRISEAVHGPAGARRYSYLPTFILRGLTHLNLEFDS